MIAIMLFCICVTGYVYFDEKETKTIKRRIADLESRLNDLPNELQIQIEAKDES